MSKRLALFFAIALLIPVLSLAATAQNVWVRGICKDEAGKPLRAATVEFKNLTSGETIRVTTGERGEYETVDVRPGIYKITLINSSNKVLFYFDRAELKPNSQYNIDFDMAQLRAEAEKQAATEEQRKQNDKIKQENEKIRGINALLQQAAQQKSEKQYAAALETLEQAAAQDQTHDVVYAALADAYMLNNKFPEAEGAYSKAISLAPAGSKSLASYHAGAALALAQEGKIDAALAECDKTTQLEATQGSICYFNEGALLTNQNKPEAANAAFDKAIAADPTRADAYYQKGVNLLAKATLGSGNKMVPAPGTVEALHKYLELAPDGQYAQSAKQLLASLGAAVETTYGEEQKKRGKK